MKCTLVLLIVGAAISCAACSEESSAVRYNVSLKSVVAAPPIQISIDAGNVVRTLDERMYGINIAIWDGLLSGPDNDALLNAMGARVIRFPAGSLSDDYDWHTDRQVSTGGPFQWVNNAATFASVAEKRGAQAYITVNYGSGTPEQAAAWVAYYNADPAGTAALGIDSKGRDWKTTGFWAAIRASAPLANDDGFNFLRAAHPAPYRLRYWEIGNESYGSFEYDQHGTPGSGLSGAPHDAATYAAAFNVYYAKMLAVDPAIRVGAVFDPAFVTQLAAKGATPHFVIYHRYPQLSGNENDANLLQNAGGIAGDAAMLRQAVNAAFGPVQGAAIELSMTELNSTVPTVGKQSVSLVNGLFMADSLGFLARSEFNSCIWWNLRNDQTFSGNNSATLYGWRQYGDYGVLSNGGRADTPANTPYPTFYAAKLMTHWGRGGDQSVAAKSDSPLLSVHAALLANGNLAVLAVNRSASDDINAQFALSGYAPDKNALVYQYGKANDLANADLTSRVFSGTSGAFAYVFPSYSMTVLVFQKAGTTPAVPPVLTSGPAVSPNPAPVGTAVNFGAAATGDGLSYSWTFGDGAIGSGSSPSHTYAVYGTYTAIVTVSDSSGGTVTGSVVVTVNPADVQTLPVKKLCIKLDFAKMDRDSIALSGTLPIPPGFISNGQNVTVTIGTAAQQFALNAKGQSPHGNDAFQIAIKTIKGSVDAQNAPFSALLNHGSFSTALNGFGLTNAAASKVAVAIPVSILFNGKLYATLQPLHYTAKAGSAGMAK